MTKDPSFILTGLDTNILLRAYAPSEHPQKAAAREHLEKLTPDAPGFISQLTLSEFYWTLKSAYNVPKRQRLQLIHELIMAPAFEFEDGESIMHALERAEAGADLPDAMIAVTHELFGAAETLTFDGKAASRLSWTLVG